MKYCLDWQSQQSVFHTEFCTTHWFIYLWRFHANRWDGCEGI